MKIEELISVPYDFEKVYDDGSFEKHINSCGTAIGTWKNENGLIIERRKVDKHENGWGFCANFSKKDIIWFFLIKNGIPLHRKKIAICSFSEKGEKR